MEILEHSFPSTVPVSFRSLVWAHTVPLAHRLRRGEGHLFAVAMSLAWAGGDPGRWWAQGLVAGATLMLLYLVNDLHDCRGDLNDPGKNRAFTEFLVAHRRRMTGLLMAEHVALVAVSASLLGGRSAVAVAAVSAVNLLYSVWLKGMASFDAPWVALWAALYLMVPDSGVPLTVVAIPAVMTAIAHAYQIVRDRDVDAINRIRTSAVADLKLPTMQIALAA
ncbi:MAG: hypothetical protein AAFQ82_24925, partial [Myxococcota bacterium]